MKADLKERVIQWISNIEVDEEIYKKIKAIVVDYHVNAQNTENRTLELYRSLNLNDDKEYDKHIARQKEIKDRIIHGSTISEADEELIDDLKDDIKSAEQLVIEARKSPDYIQKLQTRDEIGDAVVYIQNGVEIKREYPWGTDAENTVVEIKSTNREVYVEGEA